MSVRSDGPLWGKGDWRSLSSTRRRREGPSGRNRVTLQRSRRGPGLRRVPVLVHEVL